MRLSIARCSSCIGAAGVPRARLRRAASPLGMSPRYPRSQGPSKVRPEAMASSAWSHRGSSQLKAVRVGHRCCEDSPVRVVHAGRRRLSGRGRRAGAAWAPAGSPGSPAAAGLPPRACPPAAASGPVSLSACWTRCSTTSHIPSLTKVTCGSVHNRATWRSDPFQRAGGCGCPGAPWSSRGQQRRSSREIPAPARGGPTCAGGSSSGLASSSPLARSMRPGVWGGSRDRACAGRPRSSLTHVSNAGWRWSMCVCDPPT